MALGIPYLNNDEAVAVAKAFAVINGHEFGEPEGTKALTVLYYAARRTLGDSPQAARDFLNTLVSRDWYPGAPLPFPEDVGQGQPLPPEGGNPNLPPTDGLPAFLAERKIGEQLRCDGESFFSGTQVALPVGCHAGDLYGQWVTLPGKRDAILRALDRIFLAGYGFLRCWANIPPNRGWADKPAPAWGIHETPGIDVSTDAFLHELEQRGLKLHFGPGGLREYNGSQRQQLYRWISDLVSASPRLFCLIEGVNEAGAVGVEHLREELERDFIKPLVDRTGVLGALSGHSGTEDRDILRAWTPEWMRFFYYHSYRGGALHDKYRHHFSIVREDRVRRLGWSGEPTGPGRYVSATDNQGELNDPAAMALLHVQTAMCRQVPCYMSSAGVIFENNFQDMPGFAETPTAVSRLPRDVHRFALTHGGAPDRWVDAVGEARDLVRADHAFNHDGRLALTVYGERQRGVELPTRGGRYSGVWYDGAGREVGAQVDAERLMPPRIYPGSYFVGQRQG